MKRKLILIDIVLLLLVILVGTVLRSEWRRYHRSNDVTRIRPGVGAKMPANPQQAVNTSPSLPQAGVYNVVFERNLFCPNRTEFMPVASAASAPPPPPQMPGKPTLVGVTIIGDNKKIAFVLEPLAGAAPQSRTVQVGDSLMVHGKVIDIRPDALVFTWPGDVTETIEMGSDASPRTKGAATQVLQTLVVSIGGKGAKKVAAVAQGPQPGGAAVLGAIPTVQIGTAGGATASAAGIHGRTSGLARTGAAGGANAAGAFGNTPGLRQPQQNPQQNQGYMDTPFGRIQRPRRN